MYTRPFMVWPHSISRPLSSVFFPHSLHRNTSLPKPYMLFMDTCLPTLLSFCWKAIPNPSAYSSLILPGSVHLSISQEVFPHPQCESLHWWSHCSSFSAFTVLPWPHHKQSLLPHTSTFKLALCLALANTTEAEVTVPVPSPFKQTCDISVRRTSQRKHGKLTEQNFSTSWPPSPALTSWPSEEPQTYNWHLWLLARQYIVATD